MCMSSWTIPILAHNTHFVLFPAMLLCIKWLPHHSGHGVIIGCIPKHKKKHFNIKFVAMKYWQFEYFSFSLFLFVTFHMHWILFSCDAVRLTQFGLINQMAWCSLNFRLNKLLLQLTSDSNNQNLLYFCQHHFSFWWNGHFWIFMLVRNTIYF